MGQDCLSAALQAVLELSGAVVAEFWAAVGSSPEAASGGGLFQLAAFTSSQPLYVALLDNSTGATEERLVDQKVVQEFSGQHRLSLLLCRDAAEGRRPTWAYDLGGDELLPRLGFPISSGAGVPVFIGGPDGAVVGVLVLYSFVVDTVRRRGVGGGEGGWGA